LKWNTITAASQMTGSTGRLMQFDPQVKTYLEDGTWSYAAFAVVPASFLSSSAGNADLTMIKDVALFASGTSDVSIPKIGEAVQGGVNLFNVRRLNALGTLASNKWSGDPLLEYDSTNAHVLMVVGGTSEPTMTNTTAESAVNVSFAIKPGLNIGTSVGDALTIPTFESDFGDGAGGGTTPGNPGPIIPEIDIKIESLAVTAVTRKLRARWSPELAQDLNAYHSLDAEVELTQILSEQIALELDREILNDLLTQANGATLYWSRMPGKFVNKETGAEQSRTSSLHPGPAFTGTVREWYETLIETIIDCANTIHRKTLRGSANFIVVGPDVATILEASVLYKPTYSLDGDGQVGSPMTIGAEKVGSLSNRFTVYKDPYFPRNKILVGYKGGSYLETGYVYAPYVPLIVTPTIFAPEDFTPRKGVMTRYGKKMVRSDFYGTVTCMDMSVI